MIEHKPSVAIPVSSLVPGARVIDRRVTGTVDLGEPAPGRSALDQRRAAEANGTAHG